MSDDSNHRPKGFFDEQHIVDEIIRWVVRRRGLPPGCTDEDLRQEALLKLYSWLRTGRRVDNPAGLFRTIAENLLEDMHRHYQAACRDHRKEDWIDDPARDETRWIVRREKDIRESILMEELRETLSGDDREIFDQYIYEGRNLQEIAHERGTSRQAVAARWARILKKLKKKLRPLV